MKALLLTAGLEERAGKPDAAEECLKQALERGEPMGYYQVFLDEGRELASVYARVMEEGFGRQHTSEFARKICLALASPEEAPTGTPQGKNPDPYLPRLEGVLLSHSTPQESAGQAGPVCQMV